VQQKLQKLDSVMLNKVIVEDNIESDFPNVEISLRIFLTNCTTERSFSQMKRIKNPNRTTMVNIYKKKTTSQKSFLLHLIFLLAKSLIKSSKLI
jgi:hypothetical protein